MHDCCFFICCLCNSIARTSEMECRHSNGTGDTRSNLTPITPELTAKLGNKTRWRERKKKKKTFSNRNYFVVAVEARQSDSRNERPQNSWMYCRNAHRTLSSKMCNCAIVHRDRQKWIEYYLPFWNLHVTVSNLYTIQNVSNAMTFTNRLEIEIKDIRLDIWTHVERGQRIRAAYTFTVRWDCVAARMCPVTETRYRLWPKRMCNCVHYAFYAWIK